MASSSDHPHSERRPIDVLADEFVERTRRGDAPQVDEYIRRHPELAEEIREVFPALVFLDEVRRDEEAPDDRAAAGAGEIPDRLADYRIIRELGRGGMGVVYEAVEESLGRHVALKVLPFHSLIATSRLERFRREAKAAAALHHTNIVPVFGVGEHEGLHFYTMQFIRGRGLDQILVEIRKLRRGESTEGDAADESAASGSTSAIGRGLLSGHFRRRDLHGPPEPAASIHCDAPTRTTDGGRARSGSDAPVEPRSTVGNRESSSTIDSSGQQYYRSIARLGLQVADALDYAHAQGILHRDIKPSNLLLDDYGTVWITDFGLAKSEGSDELTQPGEVVGTVRYMAPERFGGHSSPHSDVFSLGLTLYEALTLQPAFDDANRRRLMQKLAEAEPTRPQRIDSNIPRDLEAIVLRAIEKDPKARYDSARDLADDLGRFLSGLPSRARHAGALERCWRWCRRNPVVATLTFAIAALTIGAAVTSTALALRMRENLRDAYLHQARANRLSGRKGRRFESLEVLTRAAAIRADLDLRNEAIASLPLVDLATEDEWDLGVRLCAFDPALERYAVGHEEGHIVVHSLADRRVLQTLPSVGLKPAILKFSPDGAALAVKYHTDRTIVFRLWDVAAGDAALELREFYSGMAFSRDGRLLALGRVDDSIAIYDVARGVELRRVAIDGRPGGLDFDPGGRRLALFNQGGGFVRVLDILTEKIVLELDLAVLIADVAWHAGGDFVAVGTYSKQVFLWDVSRPRSAKAILEGHRGDAVGVAFNSGGDLLASKGWDSRIVLWDAWSGEELLSTQGQVTPQFGEDDRRMATVLGTSAIVLGVADGSECRALVERLTTEKRVLSIDISPDSRWLASTVDRGLRIFEARTGRSVDFVPMRSPTVVFHPTAPELVTSGPEGLHAWPLIVDGDDGSPEVRVGPSRRLSSEGWNGVISISLDGTTVATSRVYKLARVYDYPSGEERATIEGHPTMTNTVLSPDGRRLVTCGWKAVGVKVWDTTTGELETELDIDGATAEFSPDGELVVIGDGEGYRLWEVGAWQAVGELPRRAATALAGRAAFAPDGRTLAVQDTQFDMRLVELETGRDIAKLEAPTSFAISRLCFSHDGRFFAAATEDRFVQLWDLERVRARLADMGLDWEPPLERRTSRARPAAARARSPDPAPSSLQNLLRNSEFAGTAGARWGGVTGSAPDHWRVSVRGAFESSTVPVEPDVLFAGSPPTRAVLLRGLEIRGVSTLANNSDGLRLAPSRDHRLSFHVKSGNADGSSQTYELSFWSHASAGEFRGELARRKGLIATDAWQRVVVSDLRTDAATVHASVGWGLVGDGGEDALLVALPSLEELVFPSAVSCRREAAGVRVAWRNHAVYDALEILRDDEILATLDPGATSYLDTDPPARGASYRVRASLLLERGGAACAFE